MRGLAGDWGVARSEIEGARPAAAVAAAGKQAVGCWVGRVEMRAGCRWAKWVVGRAGRKMVLRGSGSGCRWLCERQLGCPVGSSQSLLEAEPCQPFFACLAFPCTTGGEESRNAGGGVLLPQVATRLSVCLWFAS